MAESDTPDQLAADLERLPAAHRQQVLAALTPAERDRLGQLLETGASDVAPHPPATFEARFSPWLAARLREAEAGAGAMTAATRQQLLRAANDVIAIAAAATGAAARPQSLLQALMTALNVRRAAG